MKVEQPDTAAVVEQHAAAGMLCDGSHGALALEMEGEAFPTPSVKP